MTNLLQSASDDQTAIVACVVALSVSALFIFASFHLGPAGQKLRNSSRKNSGAAGDGQGTFDSDQTHERAA